MSRFIPACAGNAWCEKPELTGTMVHPRVCGERGSRVQSLAHQVGSSPRVRGTRQRGLFDALAARFIPACAGNASNGRFAVTDFTVHPRVCGERLVLPSFSTSTIGSSPRVRGTLLPVLDVANVPRFIPACAGNAASARPKEGRAAVHPRVCGERSRAWISMLTAGGSSPRVRGTRTASTQTASHGRFIPACAGNAAPWCECSQPVAVHPRVCGERQFSSISLSGSDGSSPRVRGTQQAWQAQGGLPRFIPACAGNATRAHRWVSPAPVHPRVCGERKRLMRGKNPLDGSSPRVRGTPTFGRISQRPRRFIPACAGNATCHEREERKQPVHPRVCGERPTALPTGGTFDGSSPRVRGTLAQPDAPAGGERFIPACAGNALDGLLPGQPLDGSSPRVRGTLFRGREALG